MKKRPALIRAGLTIFAVLVTTLAGCATTGSGGSGAQSPSTVACSDVSALLTDPQFETLWQHDGVWRYKQHSRRQSFRVNTGEGELSIARTGGEPWAVVRQKITDPRLSGQNLRYSAELKGDVSGEASHGFPEKAGLYLKLGPRPDANMADHDPNIGEWDWQRVSVEATLPQEFDYIEVGFLYQGGAGVLSARAPQLELVDCSD